MLNYQRVTPEKIDESIYQTYHNLSLFWDYNNVYRFGVILWGGKNMEKTIWKVNSHGVPGYLMDGVLLLGGLRPWLEHSSFIGDIPS